MFGSLTRRRLLVTAAGAAPAAALGGAGIGILGGAASARTPPSPEQDLRVLTFLLRLQRIERAFYDQAAATGQLQGELAEYIDVARSNEVAHVDALTQALGSVPAGPEIRFAAGPAFTEPGAFVGKAIALEDAVVAAINGQVTNLTPGRLAQACAIASVDARHAAWIRDIGRVAPIPAAEDEPLDADAATDLLRRQGLWP
jgi:Ferritin-like domain